MQRINGFIVKAEELSQYESEFDLFIGAISSEERSSCGWSVLKENSIVIERKIILYFKEVIDEVNKITGKAKVFDDLFDIQKHDYKLDLSMLNELAGLREFKRCVDDIAEELENKKIIMDFSVMVKPYMFILLKYFLDMKKIKKIYLLYTEPASYRKPKTEILSEQGGLFTQGTIKTGEIPSYSGNEDLSKKKALIILLGFEGERAIEVANAVDPDVTIPINGFPSYRPEFKDVSIISNEELLREPEILRNLKYAPANDPFETAVVLNDFHSKHYNDYNISIAPIGTKPMAMGSCLFALEHPECRIIYPYPLEYRHKSSEGYGPTWIYEVQSS